MKFFTTSILLPCCMAVCALWIISPACAQIAGSPEGYAGRNRQNEPGASGPFARKPASYNVEEYRAHGMPEDPTVMEQVSVFFKDLFGSLKVRKDPPFQSILKVEPKNFQLEERRELSTTFSVANHTKRPVVLEFPTEQRIDLEVRDGSGSVIEKWSEDRSFSPEEGFVVVNPKERIEYSEKIATREMQPGKTYHIDAKVEGYPEHQASTTVVPSGFVPGTIPSAVSGSPAPSPTP